MVLTDSMKQDRILGKMNGVYIDRDFLRQIADNRDRPNPFESSYLFSKRNDWFLTVIFDSKLNDKKEFAGGVPVLEFGAKN